MNARDVVNLRHLYRIMGEYERRYGESKHKRSKYCAPVIGLPPAQRTDMKGDLNMDEFFNRCVSVGDMFGFAMIIVGGLGMGITFALMRK